MGEEGNKTTREVQMPPLSGSRGMSENAVVSWALHHCPDPPALLADTDSPFLAVWLTFWVIVSLLLDSFSIN